jgi:hypothetical protein
MKSQQQDQTIKTNCKDCAFAIYSNDTQISCVFNRVDKFQPDVIEAYDNDKQFFVINRLCTYYRNKLWGYSVDDTAKVEEESALSFDLVFDCNSIDDNGVNNIINFLLSCSYNPKKVRVFLIHESSKHNDVKNQVSLIARNSPFVTNISIYFDLSQYMHELIMNSKNTYHVVLNDKLVLDPNTLSELNDLSNIELKRFIVAQSGKLAFVNNFIYKSAFHITQQRDYLKTVNSIVDQSKETNMVVEI